MFGCVARRILPVTERARGGTRGHVSESDVFSLASTRIQSDDMTESTLLTYQETAPRLRISISALQKLNARKEIRCVRVGRKVFFTEALIAEYINEQTQGGRGARRRPSAGSRRS